MGSDDVQSGAPDVLQQKTNSVPATLPTPSTRRPPTIGDPRTVYASSPCPNVIADPPQQVPLLSSVSYRDTRSERSYHDSPTHSLPSPVQLPPPRCEALSARPLVPGLLHPAPSSTPSATSQADAFMVSLLRAAQAKDSEFRQQASRRRKSVSSKYRIGHTEIAHPSRRQRTLFTQRAHQKEEKTLDGQSDHDGFGDVHSHPDRCTELSHLESGTEHPGHRTNFLHQGSPLLLPTSNVLLSSSLPPLPRDTVLLPHSTASALPDRHMLSLNPTSDPPQSSAPSTKSSKPSNLSSSPLPCLASHSFHTNASTTADSASIGEHHDRQQRKSSSSDSRSLTALPSVFARRLPPWMSNNELGRLHTEEDHRWSKLSDSEKIMRVRGSILLARNDLDYDGKRTPSPKNTFVTRVRCMHANIVQKSYGREKRFLCPPLLVKIDGLSRPCKSVRARVISGVYPAGHSLSMRSTTAEGNSGSAEEEVMIDASGEVTFGKLHVGSSPESRGQTTCLQINLLGKLKTDEALRASTREEGGPIHPSRNIAAEAWLTFHTAPISVVSKPARMSARTRAASPIVNGSIVCLYNRLNSQTVSTKFLSVDSCLDTSNMYDARRLLAREDEWQGFAIDLLARRAIANGSGQISSTMDDGDNITYGSIVCLRDLASHACSEPMLICKVEKGKVDVTDVTGNEWDIPMQFRIVGEDTMAVREVLAGARTSQILSPESGPAKTSSTAAEEESREKGNASRGSSDSSTAGREPVIEGKEKSSIERRGVAVVPMQRVALLQISPCLYIDSVNSNIVECRLTSSRSYLCSSAPDGASDDHTSSAFVRTREHLQSRLKMTQDGAELREDKGNGVDSSWSGIDPVHPSSLSVKFVHPPSGMLQGQSRLTDMLEDAFCWTIVTTGEWRDTISVCALLTESSTHSSAQSEISFIEADAQPSTSSPHVHAGLPPIAPFPSVAAFPSYDKDNHTITASIHDFYYNAHSPARIVADKVGAIGNSSDLTHEIWIGQYGPLPCRSSSAGIRTSDVTFQLPSLSQLKTLHTEFYTASHGDSTGRPIRLPILFVRAVQGITFISGHWLQALRSPKSPASYSSNSNDAITSWTFSII